MAADDAPFSVLRLSPAPIVILLGIVVGQALFAWSNRRVAAGKQLYTRNPVDFAALDGLVDVVEV